MSRIRIIGILFIVLLFIGLSIHVFNYFGVGNLKSVLNNYDFEDGISRLVSLNKDSRDKFVVSSENKTKHIDTFIEEKKDIINNSIDGDNIMPIRQFPPRQNIPSPFLSPEHSELMESIRKYNDYQFYIHTQRPFPPPLTLEEHAEKRRIEMEKEARDKLVREIERKVEEFNRKRMEELMRRDSQ